MTRSCWSESRSGQPRCRRAARRCGQTTMPNSLKKRLDTYHAQTAPLSHYYRKKGVHKATDGMAPIDSVTEAIGALLAAPSARKKASARKRVTRGAPGRRPAGRKPPARATAARAGSKAAPRAQERLSVQDGLQGAKKALKRCVQGQKGRQSAEPEGRFQGQVRESRQNRRRAAQGSQKQKFTRGGASKARSGRGRRLTKRR